MTSRRIATDYDPRRPPSELPREGVETLVAFGLIRLASGYCRNCRKDGTIFSPWLRGGTGFRGTHIYYCLYCLKIMDDDYERFKDNGEKWCKR